ncbi:hypothetical protein BSKO_08287 [Bryopsis sp. KO-2023]|nr:hypothetical protein BSKO_08287 [Bryopsis sp. KO-2023]
MNGWQALGEESRNLVDAGSSVPIRRSFQQVAALANSLKNTIRGGDFNEQEVNATRLLARGGVDARQLETPIRFPAKRSVDDRGGSLERAAKRAVYSENVGAVASNSAINILLRKVDESTYGRKRAEIERRQATQPFPSHALQTWAYPGTGHLANTQQRADWGGYVHNTGTLLGPSEAGGRMELPAKEQGYIDAVSRMVESRKHSGSFSAAPEFLDAASGVVEADQGIVACWTLLKEMASELGTGHGSKNTHSSTVKSLLRGTRKFLESRNDKGMAKMVQTHRGSMCIGGDPEKLTEIKNFIVYKHRDSVKLDINTGAEGMQTSWVQVYYALRSGHVREALIAAGGAKWPPATQRMRPLKSFIEEWHKENETLSSSSTDDLISVCKVWLNNPSVERRNPLFKFKVLTLAFLCGSADLVDLLGTSVAQPWESLDEYLWFFVGCAQSATEPMSFNLNKLQKRIREFSGSFYSREGKAPMMYALVLLASLQFKAAIQFLAQDSMAESYRSEAVHMALVLYHHKMLEAGMNGDVGTSATGVDLGVLVESYGHQFTRSNSFLALNYYLLAVDLRGTSRDMKRIANALRRVILESRDYYGLLGNGGRLALDHPLMLFLKGGAEIDEVLFLAAQECERFSENEEAYAIYMAAGRHSKALGIINVQISQTLQGWVHQAYGGLRDFERIQHELMSLAKKGKDAASRMGVLDSPQGEGFKLLEAIAGIFRNFFQDRFPDAVGCANSISFFPSSRCEVATKVEYLKSVDHALVHILSDVLRVYATALVKKYEENTGDDNPSERISALVAFARIVPPPFVVGKEVFKELEALSSKVLDYRRD